jgi:hypothetical protein
MRRWRLNSGYNGTTDQRRTKAGTIPSLKHYIERDLGEFGSTPWTPENISTVFWLDAATSSTITIATGVSSWADKKGGGVNATQATGSLQPTYAATAFPGSLPGVLFDGTDDVLDISTTAMQNQTHGVYWVWSRSGAGTAADTYRPSISVRASAGQGTNRGALQYVKNSNNFGACYPYYDGAALANYDLTSGTVYSNDVGNIMSFQSNTTGWGVWRNGTLESTTNTIATPNNTNVGYALGREYTPNRASNIVIAEVIMVQVTDTPTKERIEGYLAWKWALQASLPSNHPYKNSPPTV